MLLLLVFSELSFGAELKVDLVSFELGENLKWNIILENLNLTA